MAYQAHIVIPTTHIQANKVIDHIKTGMAVHYGGYSLYEGSGGWDNGDKVVEENHVRLVADVSDEDRETLKEYMRIEAEFAKDVLDEDAVLIEIQEVDMELV